MAIEVQIVTADWSVDDLTMGLRGLTRFISKRRPDLERNFGLGSEYGYGVDFENAMFMMHHFCWCGGADCPWCSYSPEEGAHYQEENRVHGAVEGFGDGLAPNFWHKPSGFRVWWYKWIGRDNETFGASADVKAMIAACQASVE